MRPAPTNCAWILLVGVVLLAVCVQGGHGKRKKIVVYVPQKVKHIHHHHVKKVYVKHKPVEYIEDVDDYVHRAGEGNDEAGNGGLGAPLVGLTTSWDHRDGGGKAAAYGGELAEEVNADPYDGWAGLLPNRHPRPAPAKLHHLEHRHNPQQQESQHRPSHERPEQQHHNHQYHDLHQQHHHQGGKVQQRPAHRQEHRQEHRQDHRQEHQHGGNKHQRQHHAEGESIPDDIRSWVNEGYEKFHHTVQVQEAKGGKKKNANSAILNSDKAAVKEEEEEDDGIRVQVFEDGKEIEVTRATQEPKTEASEKKQTTVPAEVVENKGHHHQQQHHYHHEDHQHHQKPHHKKGKHHRRQYNQQHHREREELIENHHPVNQDHVNQHHVNQHHVNHHHVNQPAAPRQPALRHSQL